MAKAILKKKNEGGGTTLCVFKTSFIAAVTKTMWYW